MTRAVAMVSFCAIAGCTLDAGPYETTTQVATSALSPTKRACKKYYESDGGTCRPRCDSLTLATGIEHCVRAREDGTVEQRWSQASEPWEGEYVGADEPDDNYCGPTAVKNFLVWYGSDEDYAVLGDEMRTNTWYGAALGGFAPIKAGTLPADLRDALSRRAPEGYTACIEQGKGDFESIRSALAAGDQVVVLESRGSGNLHWAVTTGVYLDGETPVVRLANSADRSVDDFMRDWSLARVGDSFERSLLAGFGLLPYTLIRWVPVELSDGESCL
jgi:hypothetical protein